MLSALTASLLSSYLVVEVALTDPGFKQVAREAAKFHQARLLPFDGRSFAQLEAKLKELKPENVLYVVQPETLDVNLHRHLLLLSNHIDEDIFPDFAFGYLTASDAAHLQGFWDRGRRLIEKGLASRRWMETAVTQGMKSTEYPAYIPETAKAAGFQGSTLFFAVIESDPGVKSFIDDHLPKLKGAGVVAMFGNGDPQGIWLFDGDRNRHPEKHWQYDPLKVGADPAGAMPRLTTKELKRADLAGAIVWSGVCHSCATRDVYVEGDIVSTFGKVDKATVYSLKPSESFCLGILDTGAAAFLGPIAANHGMSASMEADFALVRGSSLGEAVKATYDDDFLQAKGKLRLDFHKPGEAIRNTEQIMQGGGANRVLIGDPATRPFGPVPDPHESVRIEPKGEEGFDVVVTRKAGFISHGWDIYGTDRAHDWRVYTRVCVDDLPSANYEATVAATDQNEHPLPFFVTACEPESFAGHRYLHLQANGDRKAVQDKALVARFLVRRRR